MDASALGIYRKSHFQAHLCLQELKEKVLTPAQKVLQTAFAKCERVWSYAGKVVLMTRHSLNAAARDVHLIALAGMKFPKILGEITTRMKLLSVVSIPFSVGDSASTAKKIFNSMLLLDAEGVILSGLSFTIIAADIADSFTTFVNAILTLSIGAPLAFFSTLGLPLAFIMAGGGTVSRTIQIAKSTLLYRSIDKEVFEKNLNKDALKAFVEKSLGMDKELKDLLSMAHDQLTPQQKARIQLLKDNNKAAILRAAPGESLQELEALLAMLEGCTEESFTPEKQKEVMQRFKAIQSQIIKKMKTDGMSICANLFSLAALTLFCIGSSTPAPYVLLATAFAIRLGVVIYQNQQTKPQPKKSIGNP